MLAIELKLPNKRIIDISLPEKSKVTDILAIAEEATGLSFPAKECSLFWKGSRLGHNMTLDYYRITNRGKIDLVRKLKTGYDAESSGKAGTANQYSTVGGVTPSAAARRRPADAPPSLIPDDIHIPNTPAGALAVAEGRVGSGGGSGPLYGNDYGYGTGRSYRAQQQYHRDEFTDDRIDIPASLAHRPGSGGGRIGAPSPYRDHVTSGANAMEDLPPTPAYYGSAGVGGVGAGIGGHGYGRLPELYQPTALNSSVPPSVMMGPGGPYGGASPSRQPPMVYHGHHTYTDPFPRTADYDGYGGAHSYGVGGTDYASSSKAVSPNRASRGPLSGSSLVGGGIYNAPPLRPYESALGSAAYPNLPLSGALPARGGSPLRTATYRSNLNTSAVSATAASAMHDPSPPSYYSEALLTASSRPTSATRVRPAATASLVAGPIVPPYGSTSSAVASASPYAYAYDTAKARDYERALEDQVRGVRGEYSKALDRIAELESTVGRLQGIASRAVGASRGVSVALPGDMGYGGYGAGVDTFIGGPASYAAPIGGVPPAYSPRTSPYRQW